MFNTHSSSPSTNTDWLAAVDPVSASPSTSSIFVQDPPFSFSALSEAPSMDMLMTDALHMGSGGFGQSSSASASSSSGGHHQFSMQHGSPFQSPQLHQHQQYRQNHPSSSSSASMSMGSSSSPYSSQYASVTTTTTTSKVAPKQGKNSDSKGGSSGRKGSNARTKRVRVTESYMDDDDEFDDGSGSGSVDSPKGSGKGKKEKHKAIEKARRQKTNDVLNELKELVGTKHTRKLQILIEAERCIRDQNMKLGALETRQLQLEQQVAMQQRLLLLQQKQLMNFMGDTGSTFAAGSNADGLRSIGAKPNELNQIEIKMKVPGEKVISCNVDVPEPMAVHPSIAAMSSTLLKQVSPAASIAWNNSRIAMFIETLDFTVIAGNAAFKLYLKVTDDDLARGIPSRTLLRPSQRNGNTSAFGYAALLLSGERVTVTEHRKERCRFYDSLLDVTIAHTLIKDELGQPKYFFGTVSVALPTNKAIRNDTLTMDAASKLCSAARPSNP